MAQKDAFPDQDVEDLDVRDGGAPCNPTSSTLTTCPLDRSVCPEPVLVKHAFFLIKEDQNRRSFFSRSKYRT